KPRQYHRGGDLQNADAILSRDGYDAAAQRETPKVFRLPVLLEICFDALAHAWSIILIGPWEVSAAARDPIRGKPVRPASPHGCGRVLQYQSRPRSRLLAFASRTRAIFRCLGGCRQRRETTETHSLGKVIPIRVADGRAADRPIDAARRF